jgi:hypothetical protein
MARQVVGAVDHAFGWIPKLGPMLHRAKAAVDEFARDTDATLKSWAESAAQWGGDATHAISKNAEAQAAVVSAQRNLMLALQTDDPRRIAVAKAALDSARRYAAQVAAEMKKKKVSDKTHGEAYAEGFNIGDAYGAGLSDAVATHEKKRKAKKKKSAKDAVKDAVAEARRKAAEQLAAALFAADKAKRAMQLAMQRELDGAREEARRLQVELKLAGKAQGDLSIVNGAALNAGTSFAQLSRQQQRQGDVIVQVAGSVLTERDLMEAIHQGLLAKGRRNISVGLG